MELKEIQEIIKAENITSLRLEYPDLYGLRRVLALPRRYMPFT